MLKLQKKYLKRLILLLALLASSIYWMKIGKNVQVFYGDALGYYMYLPNTFIYDNLDSFTRLPDPKTAPSNVTYYLNSMQGSAVRTEKGYILNQYTYGTALLELPFFAAAHAWEKLSGGEATGFSKNYELAIKFSSVFYTALGLFLVYLILQAYVSCLLATIATMLLLLGTNLFWFTVHQAGMAHIPLFFLYALLIWTTIKLHRVPRSSLFAIAGLTAGMITIIRPTDIICLLIPLLYMVRNGQSLREKVDFIRMHRMKILLMVVSFIIPLIPQLVLWKHLSGHWLYYSYGDQGFNWTHPRIKDGLFSYFNGWFAYTPLMLFAMAGLLLIKRIRDWWWCSWLLVPLYIYIVYSWYCFNYINGFGSRPMIHLYPLLAIPLAAFLDFICFRKILAWCVGLLCMFFISLNITNSIQQSRGLLLSQESYFAFFVETMFRMHLSYENLVQFDNGLFQPEAHKVKFVSRLGCLSSAELNESVSQDVRPTLSVSAYSLRDREYLPKVISVVYDPELHGAGGWLKASGVFLSPAYPGEYRHNLLVVEVRRGDQELTWKAIKIENKIGLADRSCGHNRDFVLTHYHDNRWGPVHYYVPLPDDIRKGDVIKCYIHNVAKIDLLVNRMCLEIYN
ncbi:MAG: hypothetical protein EOP49_01790 [Sphingobacteriales bacterium]|nr:MAG: hypothetical protein EOP49_01790 [Sphingobacteriales bacterium]